MSTVMERVTDEVNAQALEKEMKRRRPSGKHPYKPQVATKVKWALEDCMERSKAAERHMEKVWEWLEETRQFEGMDVRVLAHFGALEHELFGLALEVSKLKEVAMTTVAEAKPDKAKSKYSEL
jgi:hypothetical protein